MSVSAIYPTRLQQQVLSAIGTLDATFIKNTGKDGENSIISYGLKQSANSPTDSRLTEVEYATVGSIICQVQTFGSVDDPNPQCRAPQQLQPILRRRCEKWGSGTGRKPQNKTRALQAECLVDGREFQDADCPVQRREGSQALPRAKERELWTC